MRVSKSKIFGYVFVLFLIGNVQLIQGQVTEKEDALKKVDTLKVNGWKKTGLFSLGFGQVALSNWSGGGVSSMSITGVLNLNANYRKDKFYWNNSGTFSFGMINQGEQALWVKNDDKIDLVSKAGRFWTKTLSFGSIFNFRSQFAPGYDDALQTNLISRFTAPAYSILAVGIDYQPNEYLTAFIAPFTGKFTIVSDQNLANAGMYGVQEATYNNIGALIQEGKNFRGEMGGYLRLGLTKDLAEWVSLSTNLDLFSNYFSNPQNIDVNWDALLSIKAGKYITTTIICQLLYDDDVTIAYDSNGDNVKDKRGPRVQFKEVLGVGFSVKF